MRRLTRRQSSLPLFLARFIDGASVARVCRPHSNSFARTLHEAPPRDPLCRALLGAKPALAADNALDVRELTCEQFMNYNDDNKGLIMM